MKNCCDLPYFALRRWKKFTRAMKLTIFLLLFSLLTATAASTYSQSTRINLKMKDASLVDIFREIERKSDFGFFFKSEDMDMNKQISIDLQNATISEILEKVLINNYSYRIIDKNIIITKSNTFEVQQQKSVTGRVTDSSGSTLPGVSVVVKGTTNGTITDMDGNFKLSSVPENAVLQFSFVGMKTQEIATAGKTSINIAMKEESIGIEEVVAVGYGTQKKVNLTGAVASVDVKDMIATRPVINASSLLSGAVPGLYVNASDQRPSNDGNSSILIRGNGTLNNSSPYVLIDGVEGSLSSVNPQDIESVSVLKDAASASIYGSRAANGVILITTKQGTKGALKVEYNGYVNFESANLSKLEFVSDYADYMNYMNNAYAASNKPKPFSQGKIDEWGNDNGADPLKYPNTNVLDIFKTAVATQHNISASGGNEKLRFFTSFNYSKNPGVMENSGTQKYSLRSNLDATLTSWLTLGTQISGYIGKDQPGASQITPDSNGADKVFTYLLATTPSIVFRAPDGRYGGVNNTEDDVQAGNNNPLKNLNSVTGLYNSYLTKARLYATINPLKGLTVTGSYSYENSQTVTQGVRPVFIDRWNFYNETIQTSGIVQTSVSNSNTTNFRYFMDGVARYENKFLQDRLSMSVMAGASQEQYRTQNFSASRKDLIDPSLSVINGATGDMSASGSASEWAMRSFFSRLNLDWKGKYLAELNLRADASSRFATDKRIGYFPSVSLGWRVSEENFMGSTKGWLDNLKLRASYGSLGNNAIGNYDALSTYGISNYVLNKAIASGLAQKAIANPLLTWESTYVANVGIDFSMMRSKLSGTIEFFNKQTKNILISLPAPAVHGTTTIPKQNAAQVTNQGVELTLGWNDRINKNFTYGFDGNITYIHNNVDKFRGSYYSISGSQLITEGQPINVRYVRVVDRIVSTDDDLALVNQMLANAPVVNGVKQTVFPYGVPAKGDFLYKDINNDGLVNDNDRVIKGWGSTPLFTYGINLKCSYKSIDFSMLLQGTAGFQGYLQDAYFTPSVRWGYQMSKEIAEGAWTPEKAQTGNFSYPRQLEYTSTINTQVSDFWVCSRSYLKIRNISLGYTLPKSLTQKAYINGFRVFGSLENFFTFTKWKGVDPETGNLSYPAMRQATLGVNITF